MACRLSWSSAPAIHPCCCRRLWQHFSLCCVFVTWAVHCAVVLQHLSPTLRSSCLPALEFVSMDPDEATRATLTTVTHVAAWAGLAGIEADRATPRGSLFQLLGLDGTEYPRSIAILPKDDMTAAIQRWQLQNAAGAAVAPTMTQLGQAGIFARTCRCVSGIPESSAASTSVPVPVTAPTVATSNTRKVKMSQVINQTDEDEVG